MLAKSAYWSFLIWVFALLVGCVEEERAAPEKTGDVVQPSIVQPQQSAPVQAAEPDVRYMDVAFSVADVSPEFYQGRLAAAVTFSAPVPLTKPLARWLKVETDQGEPVVGEWAASDSATTLYFPHLLPETSYQITVLAGLPSQLEKALAEPYVAILKTDALSPMLGFSGRGNLLAHKLTKGLPVLSRNADSVDIDFFRIPAEQLPRFLEDNRKSGQQVFWQVRDYLRKLELVYTGRFDLNVERNQQATSYIPIKDIKPLQEIICKHTLRVFQRGCFCTSMII